MNELEPDVVVISGDLTSHGFKDEYALAREYVDKIECKSMVVIPGNHDSRNVGYVHFEELFGERNSVLRVGGTHDRRGRLERARPRQRPDRPRPLPVDRGAVRATPADLRVFVLHHHLLPIPGTGRERNIVNDAGDTLETLQRANVDLVLSGHKHVPYAWRLENLFIVNAGTVSSSRLRGNGRPCYNVVEVDGTHVRRVAEVPVPRAGADHPVLDRDEDVREVHGADRGRGDDSTVKARRDRSTASTMRRVVRDALAELPYDVRRARCSSAGPRSCAAAPDYGVPLVDVARAGTSDVVDRPLRRAGARAARADALGVAVLAPGSRYVGADFRFDPPPFERVRRCRRSR